jgi:hypothetical protein
MRHGEDARHAPHEALREERLGELRGQVAIVRQPKCSDAVRPQELAEVREELLALPLAAEDVERDAVVLSELLELVLPAPLDEPSCFVGGPGASANCRSASALSRATSPINVKFKYFSKSPYAIPFSVRGV